MDTGDKGFVLRSTNAGGEALARLQGGGNRAAHRSVGDVAQDAAVERPERRQQLVAHVHRGDQAAGGDLHDADAEVGGEPGSRAVRAEEAVGDALVEMLERRLPDRHRGVAPTTVVARRASQACEVAVPRVTGEDAARDRSRRRPRRGGGRVGRDARQDAGQADGEGGREDRRTHRTRRCAHVRPQHA